MVNNCYVESNEKVICVTPDGIVRKKETVKNTISNDLCALRRQLKIYVQRYEEKLRLNNIDENTIKDLSNNWIEATLRYYESKSNDLTSAITLFEILNRLGPEIQDEVCNEISKVR